ncbi:hypothetical protein CspeluHIS016_0107880 [Cutaneotrichosporon spelunceum]|uniref:Major facilitator superfamily (MFS) profile domain-containing protein n=1 Tax=Cutaneotrichosporon spelunceum TaxID=1672016 RepID=A0AAD3Y9V0_9TREE|nr:hypothetical protein CspeluHIS016_0107880 [Cutaneotrichosporon spelunceum]
MVRKRSLRESISGPSLTNANQPRRSGINVRAAATGDANQDETGFKNLIHNRKSLKFALFASLGGVLYGYASVFGQVQVMANFKARYGWILGDDVTNKTLKGFVTAILPGRWFGGMAVGALSMLVPMFNAELAPPGMRGSLVALQQLAITFGIMVSYWIGYGTLVPAIILCVGATFISFSPRWLMLRGREDECLQTLAHLRDRSPDDPSEQYELRSLQAERLIEREAAKERYGIDTVNLRVSLLEYKRLLTTKPRLDSLFLGATVQALQQWTGINAIIYYAPTIFQQLGLTGNTVGLLSTGLVGVVNFAFTFPAVIFVDSLGRKPMLTWGEINMAISHAVIAAIVASFSPDFTNKRAGNAAIFMVFWYMTNFDIADIFPLDMRAKGMSFSSGTNWLMNFTMAMVTPVMIENIGYKAYIVFMCFCAVGVFYSVFLLPELKGLTLEEVDHIFHDTSGFKDQARRERVAKQVGLDKSGPKLSTQRAAAA